MVLVVGIVFSAPTTVTTTATTTDNDNGSGSRSGSSNSNSTTNNNIVHTDKHSVNDFNNGFAPT
eukprot:2424599-Amphidinium_carterae.1